MEYVVVSAVLAKGWAGYLLALFASAGVYVPPWLNSVDLVWNFQLRFASAMPLRLTL